MGWGGEGRGGRALEGLGWWGGVGWGGVVDVSVPCCVDMQKGERESSLIQSNSNQHGTSAN